MHIAQCRKNNKCRKTYLNGTMNGINISHVPMFPLSHVFILMLFVLPPILSSKDLSHLLINGTK